MSIEFMIIQVKATWNGRTPFLAKSDYKNDKCHGAGNDKLIRASSGSWMNDKFWILRSA
jgi:hypothetical protein